MPVGSQPLVEEVQSAASDAVSVGHAQSCRSAGMPCQTTMSAYASAPASGVAFAAARATTGDLTTYAAPPRSRTSRGGGARYVTIEPVALRQLRASDLKRRAARIDPVLRGEFDLHARSTGRWRHREREQKETAPV